MRRNGNEEWSKRPENAGPYRGTRPALTSRRHRAMSRTHSSWVGAIAVHSRARLPTFHVSRGVVRPLLPMLGASDVVVK